MTTELLVASTDSPVRDPQLKPRPMRSRLLVVYVVLLVIAAAGFGCLVRDESRTNARFDAAHQLLNATNAHLRSELSVQNELQEVLFSLESQATEVGGSLAQMMSELQGVDVSLSREQANVVQQGTSIVGLQTCLGGVEQALNALSVGDQRSAIAALNAVTSSCQSAVAASG